ncbi:hypothetical protein [Dysgonomonas sp. BGC7]|uniref:hypothetical protein n=1 Tax=Dysgonomonas sp. BGC7 TaxID=1658008 RepID=UPI000680BC2C|nr:hypothetical protein [Dysgonomonas sp. BGC7]MBD8389246.1 hypothetical protein [Dysgonomonas sp. BGC7]
MMKYTLKIAIAIGVVLLSAFFACSPKSNKTAETPDIETPDTMKLQINFSITDTLSVITAQNEKRLVVNKEDKNKLQELLSLSVNDTLWNDSGIMVKMVAPDYTLIAHNKEGKADEDIWMMIWKENGRLKVRNKWYFLVEENKNEIFTILDAYK